MLVGESGVVGRLKQKYALWQSNNADMPNHGSNRVPGLVSAGGQVQPFGGGKPSWISYLNNQRTKEHFVKWFHSKCPITNKKTTYTSSRPLEPIMVLPR